MESEMPAQRASSVVITSTQETNLVCGRNVCGGIGRGGAFPNEAARKDAWRVHGRRLLALHRAGRRPSGYWHYDNHLADLARRPHEDDTQLLYRLGLLEPGELEALERVHWTYHEADGRDPRELLGDDNYWREWL